MKSSIGTSDSDKMVHQLLDFSRRMIMEHALEIIMHLHYPRTPWVVTGQSGVKA